MNSLQKLISCKLLQFDYYLCKLIGYEPVVHAIWYNKYSLAYLTYLCAIMQFGLKLTHYFVHVMFGTQKLWLKNENSHIHHELHKQFIINW